MSECESEPQSERDSQRLRVERERGGGISDVSLCSLQTLTIDNNEVIVSISPSGNPRTDYCSRSAMLPYGRMCAPRGARGRAPRGPYVSGGLAAAAVALQPASVPRVTSALRALCPPLVDCVLLRCTRARASASRRGQARRCAKARAGRATHMCGLLLPVLFHVRVSLPNVQ